METDINKLCNIKFLLKPNDFNENELIDVVSTSLFKMEKGYKYFEKYMRGLEMAISQFSKKLPNLKFLLFIDDSIFKDSQLFNRIKKMNNNKLIIMHYSCPIGIQSGSLVHIELFGTLVRFLPFFKYSTNFTRNVICIDADIDSDDLNNLVINYDIFLKIKSQYQYDTNMFYELLAKWSLPNDYTIIASRHMCKYKFPLQLLIDFITCMKNQTCENMATIKSYMDYVRYHTFPYGTDEYFLNYILLPYMIKHKITRSVSVRYAITAPLYYLNWQNTIPVDSAEGNLLYQKLKWILDDNTNCNAPNKNNYQSFNANMINDNDSSSSSCDSSSDNYSSLCDNYKSRNQSNANLRNNYMPSDNRLVDYYDNYNSSNANRNNGYKGLINIFDQIFYPYIYSGSKNPSECAKLVAHKYYDFILELWKTENYSIFPKITLKKILNARDYISKHNIVIYYGSGKVKKYLFPSNVKI